MQGQAQNIFIHSPDGQMLFMADGKEAVVGTGKLHVLGTLTPTSLSPPGTGEANTMNDSEHD